MARSRIIAGKAVIIIEAQDLVNKTLGKVRSNLHRFSNEVGKIGEGLFRTGFFGAIGSGVLINSFVKFDDAMRTLRVNLDLFGKTNKEVEATLTPLEARIRSLAQSTPFNPTQVAQAATELAKGGFDTKEIENALQAVLDLARATNTELGFSAEFVVRTLTTYGIATENAAEIVSQLVRASRKGTLGIEDLEAAMRYSSGTADTLGVSLQKMLAIFTILSNRGLVGSIAGTSTNTALSQLVKKAQELKDIGKIELITGFRQDGREALDVVSSLENLFKFADTLPFTEQQTLFQDVFNLRGARSVSAIRKEIENIKQLTGFIAEANDEARLAAKIQDEGIGGSLRRLISTIQDLGIALGQTVEKPVIIIAEAIKELLGELNKLATLNPALTSLIILSPGILLAAGASMIVLAKGLRVAAVAAGLLNAGLTPISRVLAKGTVGQIGAVASLRKKIPSATGLGAKAYSGLESLSSKITALPRPLQLIVKLFTSLTFLSANLTFAPGLDQLTKTNLILTSLKSIRSAITGLYASTKVFVTGGGLYKLLMGTTNFKNPFIGVGTALNGVFNYVNGIKRALAEGNLAKALNPKPLLAIRGLFAATNIPRAGAALASTSKNLLSVGKAFLSFAAIARKAFSLTGLTTILEILILFGDKIPGVNTILSSFGKGFSNAFKTIGNIATFAVGPIELLKASIEAFNRGRSDLGIEGLKKAFVSLATIIGNQLFAAWNRFKQAIASTYDFIVGLFTVIDTIIRSVVTSISSVIGAAVRTGALIAEAIVGVNASPEGGGFLTKIKELAEGIALLIPGLFNWVAQFAVTFNDVAQRFIANLERAFSLANPFNDEAQADALFQAQISKIGAETRLARRNLDDDLKKTFTTISAAFQASSEKISKSNADNAEASSQAVSNNALEEAKNIIAELNKTVIAITKPATSFDQSITPTNLLNNPTVQAVRLIADALVGSVQSTRGNLLRAGKSIEQRQLEEQQKTNEILQAQARDQGILFAP